MLKHGDAPRTDDEDSDRTSSSPRPDVCWVTPPGSECGDGDDGAHGVKKEGAGIFDYRTSAFDENVCDLRSVCEPLADQLADMAVIADTVREASRALLGLHACDASSALTTVPYTELCECEQALMATFVTLRALRSACELRGAVRSGTRP
jgi:hypothetical protein